MTSKRKAFFIHELQNHYREAIAAASEAEASAGQGAEEVRADLRGKEGAETALEFGQMETAHRRRRARAKAELQTLMAFAAKGVPNLPPNAKVGLGALLDVRVEIDEGSEERTLFMLPVGAGTELNGPGGDGFISVIGPNSPVGRALSGSCAGDVVEVVIQGRGREWTIIDVC